MRDILEVAGRIAKIVPESRQDVHSQLNHFAKSCSYKAPEQMQDMWMQLSELVNIALVDEPWKKQMIEILTDTEVK